VLVLSYFFDNIYGYFQFKRLCSSVDRVSIYQKLEPNLGWQYDLSTPKYKQFMKEYLYLIPEIKFIRFRDYEDREKLVDAKFVGEKRLSYETFEHEASRVYQGEELEFEGNYDYQPANLSESVIYQIENFRQFLVDEVRVSVMGSRVVDLRTDEIAIETKQVIYRVFDKEIYNYNCTCGRYEAISVTANGHSIFIE